MLNKKQFYNLRNSITLNSVYIKDYSNNLYIAPSSVCAFFDGAIDYLNDEGVTDVTAIKTQKLYNYYISLERDPLWRDDFIAVRGFSAFDALLIYEIKQGIEDFVVMSYYYHGGNDENKTTTPRSYKIYYNASGDPFIIYKKHRYYLNEFIRRNY